MELGTILFGLLALVTGYDLVKTLWQSERFSTWLFALTEIAFVGLLISRDNDWLLYALVGAVLVVTASLTVISLKRHSIRSVVATTFWAACTFVVTSVVFAFQPAPRLGLLGVLVPLLLCTYVAPLRTQCLRGVAAFRHSATR